MFWNVPTPKLRKLQRFKVCRDFLAHPVLLTCCYNQNRLISWPAFWFRVQVGAQGAGGTSAGPGSSVSQKASRKVTKMCMIIASTFTVCWLPFQLNQLVLEYAEFRRDARMINDTIETMTYINSCVNPIIYAVLWKPFRASFLQVRWTQFELRRLIYRAMLFVVDADITKVRESACEVNSTKLQ